MRTLYLTLFILLLTSCSPCKHLTEAQQDSVRVEVRKTVEYVHDTVILEIPVQSERITTRDSTSHLENDYAQSDARIEQDGSLYHSLEKKAQEKPVPVERPVEYRDSIVYRDRKITVTVPVERELTWWQQTQMKGFWLAVIILVVIVCKKRMLNFIRRFI